MAKVTPIQMLKNEAVDEVDLIFHPLEAVDNFCTEVFGTGEVLPEAPAWAWAVNSPLISQAKSLMLEAIEKSELQ